MGAVMDELVAFLLARLDEDELWAAEASRRDDGPVHEGGVHWQWVEPETSVPVVPDPSRDELLMDDADNSRFGLWSVEEFPTKYVGPLPSFAIPSAEEVPASVAGHIIRHDPARVMWEIASKRRILAEVVPEIDGMEARIDGEWGVGASDPAERESVTLLRLLALSYSDHPGYRDEWRP